LKKLHAQKQAGETIDLPVSPTEYASRRATYRQTGDRPPGRESVDDSASEDHLE
jgi:hypothetical protein